MLILVGSGGFVYLDEFVFYNLIFFYVDNGFSFSLSNNNFFNLMGF